MDELKPYELRDPAGLIREVAERVTLTEDTAWLALTPPGTNLAWCRSIPSVVEVRAKRAWKPHDL